MAEPRTYAAQLAKRVRLALKENHPGTTFKVTGVGAWAGRPDRVNVTWTDGPARDDVERTALRAVRRQQVTLRRDASPAVVAQVVLDTLEAGREAWGVVAELDRTDLRDVTPTRRAELLGQIVTTHLEWFPLKKDGRDVEHVTGRARAWRSAKLGTALASESDEALEVLLSLAGERSSTLAWEQHVEMASELSR